LHQIPSLSEYGNLALLIILNCAWQAQYPKPFTISGNSGKKRRETGGNPGEQMTIVAEQAFPALVIPEGDSGQD
jgi:hypothetical protein